MIDFLKEFFRHIHKWGSIQVHEASVYIGASYGRPDDQKANVYTRKCIKCTVEEYKLLPEQIHLPPNFTWEQIPEGCKQPHA